MQVLRQGLVALARRCEVEAPALVAVVEALLAELERSAEAQGPLAQVALGDTWSFVDEEVPEARAAAAPVQRYDDLGVIGAGGMGEIRRVRDRELNRVLAMKLVHAAPPPTVAMLARFVEEAQVTAQLQHPSIVAVHELGRLPDGRVYFTMKEVTGRTLSEVIADLHGPAERRGGWTLRRVVSALHQASQAVAYAHERGVVHRDLKPQNVMVGAFGEVQVMDWGLAKVLGSPRRTEDPWDAVVTDRSQDDGTRTRVGAVAGTPAYMAPEQARGAVDQIDARTDVYALGATLYEVLSGGPPYEGPASGVRRQVLAGAPPPLQSDAPQELVEACEVAMARAPAERHPSALAFAAALQSWLDGSRRREQGLEVVRQAEAALPEAAELRRRAGSLRDRSRAALADVPSWAPQGAKAASWAMQDEAAALEHRASLLELRHTQLLQAALTHAPELPEAHAALAETYRRQHAAAEDARDAEAAARAEVRVRQHLDALPETHEVGRRCAAYLKGDGALTVVTDVPGAEVLLHRYEVRERRLVAVPVRSVGHTPLRNLSLPMGSYLCVLRHPDRAEVRHPVHLGRGEHWDGVRPGASAPHPIHLPRPGELEPGDCFVPAGWFRSGGDPDAHRSLPRRRLWCDGLVMRRFCVTNADYIAFLDDLVRQGRTDEALTYAPRERPGTADESGELIYGRDEDGRFAIRPDADGDLWASDWPVFQVDWHGAAAYAAWLAARTGLPWRLPLGLEWEKAARGADGRFFPWGDMLDPSWCCMVGSHRGSRLPASVESFPVDTSPYGVRGMAGNVREWCADVDSEEGSSTPNGVVTYADPGAVTGFSRRSVRGGSWLDEARYTRGATRAGLRPVGRSSDLGFRVSRPLNP